MLGDRQTVAGNAERNGAPEERAIGYRSGEPFRGRAGLDRGDRGVSLGAFLRSVAIGPRTSEERASLSLTDAAGGYTVPAPLANRLIDALRAQSVLNRAGATVVPMDVAGNLRIAAVNADVAASWRLELGAVEAGEPTFRAVDLAAKSLGVLVRVSRELFADTVNLERQLPLLIARAMAAEIDRVGLMGTGSAPEPRGINATAGIGSITPIDSAGTIYHHDLVRLATQVDSANAGSVNAFVMAPDVAGKLGAGIDTTGQPLQPPAYLAGKLMLSTSSVPIDLGAGDDESIVFAGNWAHLLIGIREDVTIRVLNERYADTGEVGFVAHARVDFAVEHAKAFAKLTTVKAVWPVWPPA